MVAIEKYLLIVAKKIHNIKFTMFKCTVQELFHLEELKLYNCYTLILPLPSPQLLVTTFPLSDRKLFFK